MTQKIKHTPEPWVQNTVGNMIKAKEIIIAVTGSEKTTFYTDVSNAARIVACVNACAGFDDPEMVIGLMKSIKVGTDYGPDLGSLLKDFEALQTERDELRARVAQLQEQIKRESI